MEKSEPTFVPEWLKSSGSVTSAVSTNHHQIASSSLLSDDRAPSKSMKNKSSTDISAHNSGNSLVSDRTTSSYFRQNSTNTGSHLRSYGSFGRTNRDKGWDKETNEYRDNDKSRLGDHRHRNYSDSLGNNVQSRFQKDGLKRTQSSISGKYSEPWSRKVSADLNSSNKSNFNNGSTLLSGSSAISTVRKAAFDRDFPSLGADERQIDYELRRVPPPGLTTNMQSIPIGYSAVTGEVGWTSALAEVPVKVGANGTNKSSVAQAALPSSASVASSMTSGLNMAETLAQGPPQVQAAPQRLEEIAIKQSKQLIPVTPSMPKALVLNSSEKSKTKVAQQQHQTSSTHHFSHSPRGTHTKSDMPKTSSLGKLQVLKPARERNGISYPTKDSLSPTNDSKVLNNPLTSSPSAGVPPPLRSPVKNPVVVGGMVPTVLEKKPSAQLRSRNDFFNLVRKKSLTNSSSPVADSVSSVSQSVLEQPSETDAAASLSPGKDSPFANQSGMNGLISNRDACDGPQKSRDNAETRSSSDVILCSEEEEAAFLRSLGWDENAGEDEGLTEEEIREFYRDASKYIKPRPSSKTSV